MLQQRINMYVKKKEILQCQKSNHDEVCKTDLLHTYKKANICNISRMFNTYISSLWEEYFKLLPKYLNELSIFCRNLREYSNPLFNGLCWYEKDNTLEE